ncbi:MAG: hypothetical protein M3Y42_12630 [Actinomycetota bacterium]|nr:hypothetical protein [Actinomycetota bacterium]MDQ2957799.1 hypothetical protein [Actinomycetota bacterium]
MSFNLKRLLLVAGASVAALAVGVSAATAAATPFKVTAGGVSTGVAKFNGAATSTSSAPALVFKNLASGALIQCLASVNAGTVNLGAQPGPNMAQILSSGYNGCSISAPLPPPVTLTHVGTWIFNAISETGGVTTAVVSGINLNVNNGPCVFNLVGSADATYTNASQRLAFAPAGHLLTVSAPSAGCAGAWVAGQPVSFQTPIPYLITTNLGPLVII